MSSRVNTRVKTLSGAKPCVLSGNVAPGVAEVGSLFPRFRASIWESCRRKVHRTVSESSIFTPNCEKNARSEHFWKMRGRQFFFTRLWQEVALHFKMLKKNCGRSTFGRWDRQNVHQTLARACFHIKIAKKWGHLSSVKSPPLSALRERWSIWCDAPAQPAVTERMGTAAGSKLQLEVANRIMTAAQKVVRDDSATLVPCGLPVLTSLNYGWNQP